MSSLTSSYHTTALPSSNSVVPPFDARNLEIKTKSIEQTLIPLVTQVWMTSFGSRNKNRLSIFVSVPWRPIWHEKTRGFLQVFICFLFSDNHTCQLQRIISDKWKAKIRKSDEGGIEGNCIFGNRKMQIKSRGTNLEDYFGISWTFSRIKTLK